MSLKAVLNDVGLEKHITSEQELRDKVGETWTTRDIAAREIAELAEAVVALKKASVGLGTLGPGPYYREAILALEGQIARRVVSFADAKRTLHEAKEEARKMGVLFQSQSSKPVTP